MAIDEFKRNRTRIGDKGFSESNNHFRSVKQAIEKIGSPGDRQRDVLEYLDYVARHVPTVGGGVVQVLDRMEHLLMAATVVDTPVSLVLKAVQRALEKKAPFHRNKNAVADAILLEVYSSCVEQDLRSDVLFAFVTDNDEEFSAVGQPKQVPHPDLVNGVFDGKRSHYCIDIPSLAALVDPKITAEITSRDEYTLAQLIDLYLEHNKVDGRVRDYLLLLKRFPIATKKPAAKLLSNDYIQHLELRKITPVKGASHGVAASTRLQDLHQIQTVLIEAQTKWSVDVSTEPLERARAEARASGLAAPSKTRGSKELSSEDEADLIAALKKKSGHGNARVPHDEIFEFALWSGRRQGQIHELNWDDFDENTNTCRYTNREKSKPFLLVGRALEIVKSRTRVPGGKIFPYDRKTISRGFTLVKKELKLPIRFQDLRDICIRRLVKLHPLPVVQQVIAEDNARVWRIYQQEIEPEKRAALDRAMAEQPRGPARPH